MITSETSNNEYYQQVWRNCLRVIKDNTPASSFRTWFEPIVPLKLVNNVLTIEVPTSFFYEYLEEHFIDLLSKTLRKELGQEAQLEYSIRLVEGGSTVTYPHQSRPDLKNKTVPFPNHIEKGSIANPFVIPGLKQLQIDPQLNPDYHFDNFIEGECNRLARTAGLTIAANPGKTAFNPLFIYGNSGLGKTHLAQAIGIKVKELHPEKIVLYVNANRFQTQYMDAVNIKNKYADFLHFYQMIDVLILDDVHEFAGKEGTQNAFFHIFNHLHQSGKQLILTSDKPPVELAGLEQRLLSRFKWGLSAELFVPDYETRKAILHDKIYNDGLELSENIVEYIAGKISTNIRELEGALVSLLAQATLNKKAITLELAETMTDKLVNNNQRELSINEIQKAVCSYFSLTPESLLSKVRKREIVQARQIAMYLSRSMTKASLSSIGSQIGGKDHATVLHSYKTVCDLMSTDKHFKQHVLAIEKKLKSTI
ncbi:MAG: chromosomal replication initiator protein DnaA [Prevotellaceae bacterium]|jgi:chromosomal replication initiator protein|nr:chromosomal replication initiator protein DnaA [Prevotellaceae bacterium]